MIDWPKWWYVGSGIFLGLMLQAEGWAKLWCGLAYMAAYLVGSTIERMGNK